MQYFFARIALALLLIFNLPAAASDQPIIQYGTRFHPEIGEHGMVVSQEMLASQVGAEILEAGGNAIDAAVATGFALAVTLPQAGNIGGGGFMLIYLAEQRKTVAVDYREMAPLAAHRDLFLNDSGSVDKDRARASLLSTGVPGTVAGLVYVTEKYGSMSLEKLIEPAIRLADKGITVSRSLAFSLDRASARLGGHPASARYFFRPDGSPLRFGDRWRQRDLARTLSLIARKGADGFYKGATADRIVAEMKRGGLITHEDLAAYKVVEREPVQGTYRGYQVVSMPPPSSGGVHLVQMLNILEGWQLGQMGHNGAEYIHRVTETMRRAYADRSHYLGDPDFYEVPVAALTDRDYARSLRDGIDLQKATPSGEVGPALNLPEESPQTTHFAVWDQAGNVVSNTYTLNFSYGNGVSVTDAGFLLNNEMDDFSAKPGVPNAYGLVGGEANAIEPRKRPLSSMTPTLLLKDGKPVLATGSPGGSRIITAVLQVILNTVDFGMNIAEASAAPRFHHQWLPDLLSVEGGISPDTLSRLQAMGHQVREEGWAIGRVQSIASDGRWLYGATDTRWPGGGAVAATPKPSNKISQRDSR